MAVHYFLNSDFRFTFPIKFYEKGWFKEIVEADVIYSRWRLVRGSERTSTGKRFLHSHSYEHIIATGEHN